MKMNFDGRRVDLGLDQVVQRFYRRVGLRPRISVYENDDLVSEIYGRLLEIYFGVQPEVVRGECQEKRQQNPNNVEDQTETEGEGAFARDELTLEDLRYQISHLISKNDCLIFKDGFGHFKAHFITEAQCLEERKRARSLSSWSRCLSPCRGNAWRRSEKSGGPCGRGSKAALTSHTQRQKEPSSSQI
jgi:hypothetical protein